MFKWYKMCQNEQPRKCDINMTKSCYNIVVCVVCMRNKWQTYTSDYTTTCTVKATEGTSVSELIGTFRGLCFTAEGPLTDGNIPVWVDDFSGRPTVKRRLRKVPIVPTRLVGYLTLDLLLRKFPIISGFSFLSLFSLKNWDKKMEWFWKITILTMLLYDPKTSLMSIWKLQIK